MAYTDLTTEQKTTLAIQEKFARGAVSSLNAVFKASNADSMEAFRIDQVQPIIDALDDSDIVPNSTDLAGAVDVTVAELKTAIALLQELQTLRADNLALLTKLAGVKS